MLAMCLVSAALFVSLPLQNPVSPPPTPTPTPAVAAPSSPFRTPAPGGPKLGGVDFRSPTLNKHTLPKTDDCPPGPASVPIAGHRQVPAPPLRLILLLPIVW